MSDHSSVPPGVVFQAASGVVSVRLAGVECLRTDTDQQRPWLHASLSSRPNDVSLATKGSLDVVVKPSDVCREKENPGSVGAGVATGATLIFIRLR